MPSPNISHIADNSINRLQLISKSLTRTLKNNVIVIVEAKMKEIDTYLLQ